MRSLSFLLLNCALTIVMGGTAPVAAATIFVGLNGSQPVQLLSTSTGLISGSFGTNDASAAVGGAGTVFSVLPDDAASTVYTYTEAGAPLGQFTFAPSLGSSYVTDLAWGDNSLWMSTFDGHVHRVSSAGQILASFAAAAAAGDPAAGSWRGVTTDGTYLYTSGGAGSPMLYRRDLTGVILGSVNTGLFDTLGLAYNNEDGSFWVGGFDSLTKISGWSANAVQQPYALDGMATGLETAVPTGPTPTEIPEPATLLLTGAGLLLAARFRRRRHAASLLPVLAVIAALPASAAISIQSFSAAPAAPQLVGTPVVFTTVASDTSPGDLRYRFTVTPPGGPSELIIDYATSSTFAWTPVERDGIYEITVSVKNRTTGEVQSATSIYNALPRATSQPVVSGTVHPLIALYSAPACPSGSTVRVRFKRATDTYWNATPPKPCTGVSTLNFHIIGMYASTAYVLRQDVIAGPRVTSGPVLNWTTGPLPAGISGATAVRPLGAPTRTTDGAVLFATLFGVPVATDADGTVIWYHRNWNDRYLTRPVPGGNVISIFGLGVDLARSGFREYSPTGEIVKELTVERLNERLAALGKNPINAIHHEARRLADGRYLMLGMPERLTNQQGQLPFSILGDSVAVLTPNLDVAWYWDGFDHLDVTRSAVLGETCATGEAGCVVLLAQRANDWTHANSVALAPDGNIIISARHQDFVYKIAFGNGSGNGHLIWRLGRFGDFTWPGPDPFPWFSHTHDAEYESANVLSVFDNAVTRRQVLGGTPNSRLQALQLDEVNRTVTFVQNADLGTYSAVISSAQRLSNGNYAADSGSTPNGSSLVEIDGTGTVISELRYPVWTYRAFRMRDLYSAPW